MPSLFCERILQPTENPSLFPYKLTLYRIFPKSFRIIQRSGNPFKIFPGLDLLYNVQTRTAELDDFLFRLGIGERIFQSQKKFLLRWLKKSFIGKNQVIVSLYIGNKRIGHREERRFRENRIARPESAFIKTLVESIRHHFSFPPKIPCLAAKYNAG